MREAEHEHGDGDDDPATEVTGDEAANVTDERSHFDGLEPGAGCTEIWEHLSERRERAGSD